METDPKIKHIITNLLDLPPSCIEFCTSFPDYFLVGTYNLEKSERGGETTGQPQSRNGSLLLFKISPQQDETVEGHTGCNRCIAHGISCNDQKSCKACSGVQTLCLPGPESRADIKLTLVQTAIVPSALLDLHFCPGEPDLLAAATSTGVVSFFRVQPTTDTCELVQVATHQLFDESTLVLSLAWHPSNSNILGVTLSSSNAALLNLSSDRQKADIIIEELNPHDGLEAWTLNMTASSGVDGDVCCVYSGGDDSKLRYTIVQNLESSESADEVIGSSGQRGLRGHEAGVVAILPLPLGTEAGKDILVTGSYDDHIRVYAMYDYRPDQMPRPKVLTELKIGGGVWRLKFLRSYSVTDSDDEVCYRVLASCMHAGARVLEVKGRRNGEWSIEVLGRFEKHTSMNYGSDVQPGSNGKKALCVSTSFYDKLLCVWRFKES